MKTKALHKTKPKKEDADSLRRKGELPLETLTRFSKNHLKDIISIIHILPFFPYSSDDGFSVIDYRRINPDYGNWSDIDALAKYVDVCFDFVINHVSSQSAYFKGYLAGDPVYEDFFIAI